MTVEIKQLVVRAVVDAPREDAHAQGPALTPSPARTIHDDLDVDAIVSRCVREVLRTLERRRDR